MEPTPHVTWEISLMETFHLLSTGGVKFNKKRFEADVKLFNVRKFFLFIRLKLTISKPSKTPNKGERPEAPPDELPPELDFFRYAKTNASIKRKLSSRKPREDKKDSPILSESDNESEPESSRGKRRKLEDGKSDSSKLPKQRVTSKGKDIPAPLETFAQLRERYQCPALILTNLEKNGWKEPTGVQAHGIPMLMEVGSALTRKCAS